MKNPINILREEHMLLQEAIETGKCIQQIEDNSVYYNLMHDFIIFIRNYTEIYHYPKEENVLYPLLQNRTKNMSAEFMHEICDNHDDFKSLIAEIENHYVDHDYRQLRLGMSKYLHGLSNHINRENKNILNVASNLFSGKELEMLSHEFIELDKKYGEKDELSKEFYKIRYMYTDSKK